MNRSKSSLLAAVRYMILAFVPLLALLEITAAQTPDCTKAGVVQFQRTELTSKGSRVASILLDDTIPQSSEGAELMSIGIRPLCKNSSLLVEALVYASEDKNTIDNIVLGLFRDSQTDALAAGVGGVWGEALGIYAIPLTYYSKAPRTDPLQEFKFRLRIGGDWPASNRVVLINAGTTESNGIRAKSQGLGGVLRSYIQVTELISPPNSF